MIIITENNFQQLNKIPKVEDVNTPDNVVYSCLFTEKTTNKITELLNQYKENLIFLSDNPLVSYKNFKHSYKLPKFLEYIKNDIEKITNLLFNSCIIQKGISEINGKIFLILGHNNQITTHKNNSSYLFDIKNGSLFVQRDEDTDCFIKTVGTFFILTYLNIPVDYTYTLSMIYLSYKKRIFLKNKILNGLKNIHLDSDFQNNEIKKYINIQKHIGSGDWGNVYSECLNTDYRKIFAVKMSRIKNEDLKEPYSKTSNVWYEFWMLKDIIKPLIEKNICPNLPLYIDTFLHNKGCDFIKDGKKKQHPCVITIIELASGDLKKYLEQINFTEEQLHSVLFQLFAGLHSIQMTGQIFMNDIKAANILYYDIEPGGYWHYRINNIDFYVPNYGQMFILNDFGVSTLYNPNFQLYPNKKKNMFNLGSRYAININEKFSPIKTQIELKKTEKITWKDNITGNNTFSNGATYNIDKKSGEIINLHTELTPLQKSYLFSKGVNIDPTTYSFFEHPYIIPPFEFYNDVQDVLRMFVGGKRSSQKGFHKIYSNIPNSFKLSIKQYLGISRSSKSFNKTDKDSTNDIFKVFSYETYHVLAGSFIIKFFTTTVDYTKKPKEGEKISFFNMKF